MKKILALTLTGLLVLGGTGMAVSASATSNGLPVTQAEANETSQSLYLVPGTYVSGGEKLENTISSGATKLTDDECAEIFTENAYLCTLAKGATLPVPSSSREDKDGNAFIFNGWWTIVDATVTYFDKVPELTDTTYLYADWRAEVSQSKDPVEPDESTTVQPLHYMSIKRAATGEEETVTLRVSGTDRPDAEKLGYDRAVQLYNGWFELNPGDVITVYATGLGESTEAQVVPLEGKNCKITLENSGDGSNVTASYLTSSVVDIPTLTYRKSLKKGYYRIYIKFFSAGSEMAVYMEQMS